MRSNLFPMLVLHFFMKLNPDTTVTQDAGMGTPPHPETLILVEQLRPQHMLAVTGKEDMLCPLRLNIVPILGGKMERQRLPIIIVGPVYYRKARGNVAWPQTPIPTLTQVPFGHRWNFRTFPAWNTCLILPYYIAPSLLLRLLTEKLAGRKADGWRRRG